MLDYYRFKQVHELYLKGRANEAKSLLRELQGSYVNTCDENSLLKAQIREYEDILYISKNLTSDGHSYWLRTGSVRQGPFCLQCYNKENLLIRMADQGGQWHCPHCTSQHTCKHISVRPSPRQLRVAMGQQMGKVIPLYE